MTLQIAPFADKQLWDVHAPDGHIAGGKGRLHAEVRDDGQSWWVDQQLAHRSCQRSEICTPITRFSADTGVIDLSFEIAMAFENIRSNDLAYVGTGQIQSVLHKGDRAHPPIANWNWHGHTMWGGKPDRPLVWLESWSEKEGQRRLGPFSAENHSALRIRANIKRGHLKAWIDNTPVFEQDMPLGHLTPHVPIVALGLYCGEHGIPVGSGGKITADYRNVRIRTA